MPTAGSAAGGGEGVVEEPQGLVLSVWAKTNPYAHRGWGQGGYPHRFPLLLPDQVPGAGTLGTPPGFRKFHICELFEHLESLRLISSISLSKLKCLCHSSAGRSNVSSPLCSCTDLLNPI